MSKHEKACWLKVPPECPVKVPVALAVELQIGVVEAAVGELQGGEGCCRVCVGGLEFTSEITPLEKGAKDVLEQLAQRVKDDLAVGRVVRDIVSRKPVLARMLEAVAAVLVGEVDRQDMDALLALTSLQQPEAKKVS